MFLNLDGIKKYVVKIQSHSLLWRYFNTFVGHVKLIDIIWNNFIWHFTNTTLNYPNFTIKAVTWLGNSASSYFANKSGFIPTFLKGTNWTISLDAFLPLSSNNPLSPSNFYILSKSELPTPTIIIDRGRWQLLTNKLIVASMSWISPSVNINKIW
jgi:hypothetical protein